MTTWGTALVERWLPPGLSVEKACRGRFFLSAWLSALPLTTLSLALYVAGGAWGQIALASLLLVSGVVSIGWFRRSGQLAGPTHLTLGAGTVVFSLGAIAQSPPDLVNVALLVAVPLFAGFMFGRRHVYWLLVPVVAGIVALGLAYEGITLPVTDETPYISSLMNFALMMSVVILFTRTFEAERTRALDELRASDRAKSALIATVSHEIRTPMNGVLGMVDLLLGSELTPSQREQLEVVQRSGRMLVALVTDVLDAARIEAKKLEIETMRFDLVRMVHDLQLLFASAARTKRITLSLEVDPGVPRHVVGDPTRLAQVLGNLIHNGVKFTEHGGVRITVERASEQRVRFVVRDSGIGIAPERLTSIFARFEQGAAETVRRFGGSGLGLSLARELLRLMGGSVAVESAPGLGTTFTVELPLPAAPSGAEVEREVATSASPTSAIASDTPRGRVLVVDDDEVNIAVALGLLARAGLQADAARSGREALERIAATGDEAYALVLMDLHMPEMDGLEATRRMRAAGGRMAATPIVGVTASTLPDELQACRDAGMDTVISKPVTSTGLRRVLTRALPADAA